MELPEGHDIPPRADAERAEDEAASKPSVSRSLPKLILKGSALLEALARTVDAVKWIRRGDEPRSITPEMAIAIVKAGLYEGKVRRDGRRVYFVREVDPRPEPARDDSFWFGMPAIRRFDGPGTDADYSADPEVRARLAELRRRDAVEEISRMPSGKWIKDDEDDVDDRED